MSGLKWTPQLSCAEQEVNRLERVIAQAQQQIARYRALIGRYLDNHCANSDAEGMSTLCECRLCHETRLELAFTVLFDPPPLLAAPSAPTEQEK